MTVTETYALKDINGYAAANRVTLTDHAERRARQRNASISDIRHGLMTAQTCKDQGDGTWKVFSEDLDGDELVLIVVLQGEDLVVTVF